MNAERLLARFLQYVQIDTTANEASQSYPSSAGQWELGALLVRQLHELGLDDVQQDEHGLVWATIPATAAGDIPAIAFNAHLDTSPETSGTNVRPQVIRNYGGGDLVLPGDPQQVIRVAENPALEALHGATLITTDGTTLLGGDDKAGLAVIVEAAAYLTEHPEIPHGPIRILFTCDEEIGRGVNHVDLGKLGATVCYTLDGSGAGEIDVETFSADLATVTVRGVNIHPSIAKGRMVNAVRAAGEFLARLPHDRLAPEATDGRLGFIHPYHLDGGVGQAVIKLILRDFETAQLARHADLLKRVGGRRRRRFSRREDRGCHHAAVSQHGRRLGSGTASGGICRAGSPAAGDRCQADDRPRRDGRGVADRKRAADSKLVHGATQSAFTVGMGMLGRDGPGSQEFSSN